MSEPEKEQEGGLVPKRVLGELVSWLQEDLNKHPQLYEDLLKEKGPSAIVKRLERILQAYDDSSASTEMPKGWNASTYNTNGTAMRSCLERASYENWKSLAARLEFREKKKFSIKWSPYETYPHARSIMSKVVVWFNRAVGGTFVDLLVRGGQSMADEFGVELIHHPVKSVSDLMSEVQRLNESKLEPRETGVIFGWTDWDDGHYLSHDLSARFHVVQTTLEVSDVHQDNTQMGDLIADEMIQVVPVEKEDTVVVVVPQTSGRHDPTAERVASFYKAMRGRHSAKAPQLEEVKVPDSFANTVLDAQNQTYSFFTNCVKKQKIKAVYATTGDIAKGVVSAVYSAGLTDTIRVYSADITPELLFLMHQENSPLEATCGIDPYFYGRYMVRAAVNRQFRRSSDEGITPLLVRKDDVLRHNIVNTAQLLRRHPLLRLDHKEHGWEEWMKHYCPYSYGPDLVRRKRTYENSA